MPPRPACPHSRRFRRAPPRHPDLHPLSVPLVRYGVSTHTRPDPSSLAPDPTRHTNRRVESDARCVALETLNTPRTAVPPEPAHPSCAPRTSRGQTPRTPLVRAGTPRWTWFGRRYWRRRWSWCWRFAQGGPRRKGRRRLRSARPAILESVSYKLVFAQTVNEHGAKRPRRYTSFCGRLAPRMKKKRMKCDSGAFWVRLGGAWSPSGASHSPPSASLNLPASLHLTAVSFITLPMVSLPPRTTQSARNTHSTCSSSSSSSTSIPSPLPPPGVA